MILRFKLPPGRLKDMNDRRDSKKIHWDGTINIGTMIHLCILLVTITLAWGAFDKRTSMLELEIQQMSEQSKLNAMAVQDSAHRTERIERYIISRDPKYLRMQPEGK
jgi:hypothetical protein